MAIRVSVIIPTYNRRDRLRVVLDALCKQSFPKEVFEVIVVNDGSTQDILPVVDDFRDDLNIRYIRQKRSGPGAARNQGVKNARAEIICFIDDDCIPEKHWVEKFYMIFKDNAFQIIGGLTAVRISNLKAVLGQFMAEGAIRAKIGKEKRIVFLPTSNVGLRKDVFQKFLFNSNIPYPGGEDLEFFWRLFKYGYNLEYNPDIKVLHLRNESFKEFLLQPYIYGRGNYWVKKNFPDHPALQELKNWRSIVYSFIQIPLYSLHIAFRIYKEYNKKFGDFIILFFYAIIYRLAYFWGYAWEGINNHRINKKVSLQDEK